MHDKKNSHPLITIGIPVVKSLYLQSALQSAIEQSYNNLEIVVLNNAATSDTKEEIKEIVKSVRDPRIKYFENQVQLPITENWNKLISLSGGVFFSLLSDDDYWDSEFILKLYQLSLKYPDCSVFHSRIAIVDENNVVQRLSPLCNEFEDVLDFIWHREKGYREQYVSDFLIKTGELKSIGGFFSLPGAWGSDDITWCSLAKDGGVAFSNEVLFYYRVNAQNVTNTMSVKSKIAACYISNDYLLTLVKSYRVTNNFDDIKKSNVIKLIPLYYKMQIIRWNVEYYHNKYHIPQEIVRLFCRIRLKLAPIHQG